MQPTTATKVRSDYGLRVPGKDEVRSAFGTFERALRATGGDIAALCFCIANPTHIPPETARAANVYDDGIADQLRAWTKEDREAAMCKSYNAMQIAHACGDGPRPSVAEVMRQHNASFDYTTRVLRDAGLRT